MNKDINAIDIVKQMVIDGQISQEVAEKYFPQLEESKDKRIIRSFIRLLKAFHDVNFPTPEGFERKDMIVWLEKQGEQKHTAEEVLIKAGLKPYKDGDQWCVLLGDNIQEGICGFGDTIEDALYRFLKDLIASQGPQKPAEWSEEDESMLNFVKVVLSKHQNDESFDKSETTLNDCLSWFKDIKSRIGCEADYTTTKDWSEEEVEIIDWLVASFDCLKIPTDTFYQSKVRPFLISLRNKIQPIINEWSEEDKEMYGCALAMVAWYEGEYKKKVGLVSNWLKSLKDRIQPQSKQEWSDEDYNEIETIACHLDNINNEGMAEVLRNIRDKYYHIIPQKYWKPTGAQLASLEIACDRNDRIGFDLTELLKDLKKLKE